MKEDLLNIIISSAIEEIKKEEANKKKASKESICNDTCDCCNECKCDNCEDTKVEDCTVSIDYNVYEEGKKGLTFAFNIPLAKEFITLEHKLGMIRVTTRSPKINNLVSDANVPLLKYNGETVIEIPDIEYFDTSKISASFENGILWVTVPRSKNSVARTIEIK